MGAGARNDRDVRYTKYNCGDNMLLERYTPHQVFLAHGWNVLIEEQYFLEDEANARWFWKEGYEERLDLVGDGTATYGYDSIALWVNARESVLASIREHRSPPR